MAISSVKLHSILDVLGLLVGSIYCTIPLFWLVFHPFVERWRKYGRRAYMAILPLWGLFIAAAFALGWPFRHLHLYESKVPWAMGVLFILAGFSIYRSASQGFNRAKISGLAELEPQQHDQKLVVTGIRTQVRHPYLSGPSVRSLWLDARHGLDCPLRPARVCGHHRSDHDPQEDAELESRFGDLYRQYRDNVPALLPKFPL